MRKRAVRAAETGFTLVELLVVMALVAILAGLAAARVSGGRDLDQVAKQTRDVLGEASREASSAGPIPAEILAAGETAQVRVHIWGDGTNQFVGIERFADQGGGFDWELVKTFGMSGDHRIAGYRGSAEIDPGAGPQVTLGPTDQLTIDCDPRGSCAATTLYLEDTAEDETLRVVTMPLGGAPRIFRGW